MRLLCESMFIQTRIWTLIIIMVEREVFLMRPKHQNYLPWKGECVYGAQSWKEMRLSCESMFISIERWTSILRMVEREVFLMKPKH